MAEQRYSLQELGQIADAMKQFGLMETGQKHDPSSTVSNWAPAHGPGGLFSGLGVRPSMYATVPQPMGLEDIIPLRPSRLHNEVYEILTGQTATEGSAAADICSEGPFAGKLKVCRQVIPYATGKLDTETERITSFGRRDTYADLDRNVLNQQAVMSPLMPSMLQRTIDLNNDAAKKFYEAGLAWKRSAALVDINGVAGATSNAADYNLWITQYNGLRQMITTGHVDSVTLVACESADSRIVSHNAAIASNGVNGQSFIANLVNLVRSVKARAQRIGMRDTVFGLVVHPNAWWGITDQWACAYYTDRCTGTGAGDPVVRDAQGITNFRDEMRNGQYLLVDGMRIPVIFSDGVQWDGVSAGVFNTDIYIVPLSWSGNPLLYRQFFPLNNSSAMSWIESIPDAGIRIENNGLYAIGGRTTNGFCSRIEMITQQRLILDAPFLAGSLDDVQITYLVSGFDPYPGMSDYRDGGQSTRFN